MSKTLRIALVVIGGIVSSALIFGGGIMVAKANWGLAGFGPNGMTLAPAPRAGVGGNGMM